MQTKFEQLLDYIVNEETDKANELFHEIVVEKSRSIYETLIAEEEKDEEDKEEDKDKEKEVDESFDEFEEESVLEIGDTPEDETDDLMKDVQFGDEEGAEDDMGDMGDMGDEVDMGAEDEEGRISDLEDELEDLKAKFQELLSSVDADGDGDHDMADHDEEDEEDEETKEEDFLREYVDKVPEGHGAEKKGKGEEGGVNTKSPVAGKNDMGGTAANILAKSKDETGGTGAKKPQDMKTGNINVPGGKAGSAFSKKEPGHGAEKKGAGEVGGVNSKSIVS
jgi:hypothetical protein